MLRNIKSFLTRIYQRQISFRQGRRSTVHTISHDAKGIKVSWLTMENERGEKAIVWRDTISIHAYKRDVFAVDLICLCIVSSGEDAVEIDEEMQGWDELIKKLPDYLTGCKKFEEWFETVAFPAFELNLTEIYKRAK